MQNRKNKKRYEKDNIKSFMVSKETTLLPFIIEKLSSLSRTEVKALLKYKHIAVKGKPVTQFDLPLLPGDKVDVNFGRSFYQFSHPQIKILYEDEWMIVIEKSSGLLSVANETTKDKTAHFILREYIRRDNPEAELFVCHRLDQFTSGILIFSKDEALKDEMRENWDFYVKERKYVCVTERVPDKLEDDITSYLEENNHLHVHSTSNANRGKLAATHYKVIQSKGRYALVDVEIFTGKKNQIRVHMSDIGAPIAGDMKYGAETNPAKRLMLHNYRLSFIHPVKGELMRFSLSIPYSFKQLTSE
ncbi:MAG: RluA family pseudouridine synthase [Bacteroidaceae bacterium]|nr:RluA family pseudouridine synthase [Bacteroidaceae bacterium]MBO7247655.1 RluA family pseudouridine synthase [Bacteroidaceae bacterium]